MIPVPLVAPTNIETPSAQPPQGAPTDKPVEKADDRQQQKFAALVRKEKAAVQKMQEVTAKEQAMLAKEQEIAQREARVREFESVRTQSPIKALEMLGYNYNQLSEAMLNEGKVTPEMQIRQVESKIQEMQRAQDQKEAQNRKAAEDAAIVEQGEVLEAFQNDIKLFVDQNKAKYPLIEVYDEAKLVFASIDDHYTKTGKIVSIEQACEYVEKYLEGIAEKALGVEKIRQKVLPQKEEKKPYTPIWEQPKPKVTTLSNDMTPSTPQRPKKLTEEEKIRRAVERVWASR